MVMEKEGVHYGEPERSTCSLEKDEEEEMKTSARE